MLLRIALLFSVVASFSIVASAPFADDKTESAPKSKAPLSNRTGRIAIGVIDDRVPMPKVTKPEFEAMMKSLSNWGRWGAADEMGTLNLITPEKRKQAAGLIKDGVTVSLPHNVSKTAIAGSRRRSHRK